MTSFSLKGVVPFLLSNGFSYVLREKFCQDDLKNYFNDPWGEGETTPEFMMQGTMITLLRHNTLLNQLRVMFEGQQVNGMSLMKLH